ncbi:ABC transporter permease [Sphingobacterium deserti]|nr:ABC transporter permease [Sphingobacterium deserti]
MLNIGGLAIGMAAAMLVLLWIQNEISFDMFHPKRDRLYMAGNNLKLQDGINTIFLTPKPLAPELKSEFPEIANTSRHSEMGDILIRVGDKKIKGFGAFVDSTFLQMFGLPLIKGDKNRALVNPTDIVITRSLAKTLFGTDDVLGKTMRLEATEIVNITGVMEDIPRNSRFNETQFLMSWTSMEKKGQSDQHWGNNTTTTYVELTPQASFAEVNKKIRDITVKHRGGNRDAEIFLHALPDWWLYSKFENGKMVGGRIDMIHAFLFIAVFILLISCINFTNLSTARSERRAKEVGIRKVVGSSRRKLIGQFLSEAILIALIAGTLALVTVWICLPLFSSLLGRAITIDISSARFWFSFFGFILFTGILAGTYPAFFLTSFQPVKVLKGTFHSVNSAYLVRRFLVAIQFTVAATLIICTFLIQRQLEFGRMRENGYDRNNLIYIAEEGNIVKNRSLIKNELLNSGVAESVTRTSSPLTESWSNSWGFAWKGKDANDKTIFDMISADDQFAKTAGLKLIDGRDFDLNRYPTDSLGILLNESAVRAMGFVDPLGQIVQQHGADWHVIGVVEDFILSSPFEEIPPMVILGAKGWFNVMHIKFNSSLPTSEALKKTEEIFTRYNAEYPFTYTFVDQAYAQKFEDSERHSLLAGLFSFITIAVSCLGLFALSAYIAENRKKEIGVRKVMGASVLSITRLLSTEFALLVLISCIIAFPISYWFTDHFFLQTYTYRIPVSWDVFALAGTSVLLIALATVSTQAIKAALANPVTSLRNE